MENNGISYADVAAMTRDGNNGMNWNSPMWLIWALLFANGGFGGFGRNGQGVQDAEIVGQLNGIRDTMSANQNANAIGAAIGANHEQLHGLAAAIANASTANLLSQKDSAAQQAACCCDIKTTILGQGSALQSRIDQLANGTQQGFASLGYALAQQTNELNTNATANTQRILDHLCAAETQSLRDKLLQASQDAQTASIVAQLKTTA